MAFSGTGHTQAKTATKQSAKTSNPHSQQAKKTANTVTTKSNGKKNSVIPTPSPTKKGTPPSTKQSSLTKTVVPTKASDKKQTTTVTKTKNSTQNVAPSKTNSKTHFVASVEPSTTTRKHTVISSRTVSSKKPTESISTKTPNHKKHTKALAHLELRNNEAEKINHADNYTLPRPVLIEHLHAAQTNTAHVVIETSLFLDGLEAGLSKELILQLIEIFAWDIDFATNLRPGDQFTIVYGKKLVDGKESDTDEIIAAEFVNQGTPHAAVRYIDETGTASYYTPDGQSMQRAFLSAPVDFIKISSPFDTHRKHPILNRIRAHKGIDYAARTGTPVKTTGDGIVTFCGRNGAYGQVVIIQHNDHYETLYAHLSDFKKGLTVGDHVKQGDMIGYVGQTGLATGPHLHYEFHVDGTYRDPETVKIPHSMPIRSALLDDFNSQTQPFFSQLVQAKAKSLLAKNPATVTPEIEPVPSDIETEPSSYD
ncbi:MAG: peptidoglycan DD-metalloendopeptidase family protein [Methylobacter sp.]